MAMKSSAGAISLIAAWNAFGSVVEPDFELTQKIVRCSPAQDRKPRTDVGVRRVEDAQLQSVAAAAPLPADRRPSRRRG